MRTPVHFNEYRKWYYFFQYQFFVRSEQGSKRLAPESRIAQFLRNLTYDFNEEHYRWEIPTRAYSLLQKKPAKQKNREKFKYPVPSSVGNIPIIFVAKNPSIRHRYMLFDFPKGHRADHIPLLYKALIAFDMLQNGKTAYEITKYLINNSETLPSIAANRANPIWYDQLFDNNLGKFERLKTADYIIDEDFDNAPIERYAGKQYMSTTPQVTESSLRGDRDGQHDPVRSRSRDIHRYKVIAEKLIHLAQTGQFKTFPSEIAHIK